VAGSTYAVLIAVENYQQLDIRKVPFAVADARAMQDVLVNQMEVPAQNVTLWTDQDVTQNRLNNELPYDVTQLGPDDRFIFFYAGHGFYASGSNRLTTWDSHTFDIEATTTCLDKVLLLPLRKGKCRRSLVFIDACATNFADKQAFSRDVFAGMRKQEFAEFVASTDYAGAFFSCSPTERSHSSPTLQHGIWTYHLVEALQGNAQAAFDRDRRITGDSLKNYLAVTVPKFIREKTQLKAKQRPYAVMASNGAFEILHLPEKQPFASMPTDVDIRFEDSYFRVLETRAFKQLDGFDRKRGHTVPTRQSSNAAAWAGRLLHAAMAEEIGIVEQNSKSVLKLKRRDIRVDVDESNGGTVDTDFFRFSIFADQNPDHPAEVLIERKIILRVSDYELPLGFDEIFPTRVDEIVIPFLLPTGDYDELADALESFADAKGAQFEESRSDQFITLSLPNRGPIIAINTKKEEMVISAPGKSGCLAVIKAIRSESTELLIGTVPRLIGSPAE
jgi:hypothetical protein